MPVLTNPLLSIGAKKVFAKSVTFYRSRGQDLARQRVIPANPRTVAQVANRDKMTTANMCSRFLFGGAQGKPAATAKAGQAGRHETWLSYGVRILRASFGILNATKFTGTTASIEGGSGLITVNGSVYTAEVGDAAMAKASADAKDYFVRAYNANTGELMGENGQAASAGDFSINVSGIPSGDYTVRAEVYDETTMILVGLAQKAVTVS